MLQPTKICIVSQPVQEHNVLPSKTLIFIRNVKLHLKQEILLVNTESNTVEFLQFGTKGFRKLMDYENILHYQMVCILHHISFKLLLSGHLSDNVTVSIQLGSFNYRRPSNMSSFGTCCCKPIT